MLSQLVQAIHNPDTVQVFVKKLAPPLVTLLSAEAEIQYVALRNINLIIQRYPEIMQNEIKVFFCKYNDPIFVKLEKLETMIKLAAEQNIEQVRMCTISFSVLLVFCAFLIHLTQYTTCWAVHLNKMTVWFSKFATHWPTQVLLEFKEYATEVDVDFVRKSVRAIGRCAISIERAAERCISVLLELIGTKVNYVVQEAIVVIKDIFRRYPNQYEGVIGALCDSLDTLDEPEAKASMVWIIGEYAERIDNAEELLEVFLDTFLEEAPEVQLQLLTAAVKLFLKKPSNGPQTLIQTVLNQATTETDDPDLRDRAYIYWRLLSSDPEAAKEVVLASKPMIRDDRSSLDAGLLQELLCQLSTLSSVYYKLPSAFVPRVHANVSSPEDGDDEYPPKIHDGEATTAAKRQEPVDTDATSGDLLAELMDDFDVAAASTALATPIGANHLVDVTDLGTATASSGSGGISLGSSGLPGITTVAEHTLTESILLSADKGAGLEISGAVVRGPDSTPLYNLTFTNHTQIPLDGFQLQFNKNTFRLSLSRQPQLASIAPGDSRSCQLHLSYSGQSTGSTTTSVLQVAVKSPRQNQSVFYFTDQVPLESVLLPEGRMDKHVFLQHWHSIPDTQEQSRLLPLLSTMSTPEAVAQAFNAANMFFVSQRPLPGTNQTAMYLSGKVPGPQKEHWMLLEMTFTQGAQNAKVAVRSYVPGLASLLFLAAHRLLSNKGDDVGDVER